jgi:hypothetical protein
LYKSKYVNYGVSFDLLSYQSRKEDIGDAGGGILVLVEDCLSAIKVARRLNCKPLLTSTLGREGIAALAGLYDTFLVWLDGNMYHRAQEIAQRFQLLGRTAMAVYTEKDPKEYSDTEIQEFLDKSLKMCYTGVLGLS